MPSHVGRTSWQFRPLVGVLAGWRAAAFDFQCVPDSTKTTYSLPTFVSHFICVSSFLRRRWGRFSRHAHTCKLIGMHVSKYMHSYVYTNIRVELIENSGGSNGEVVVVAYHKLDFWPLLWDVKELKNEMKLKKIQQNLVYFMLGYCRMFSLSLSLSLHFMWGPSVDTAVMFWVEMILSSCIVIHAGTHTHPLILI